jgi:hypothetical protein
MEFPPEIVAIIREYSLPRFKYFREYKRVMLLSGIVRWPLLKDSLLRIGDQIYPYLMAYEQALVECNPCSWETLPHDHATRRRARTKALNELVVRLIL